MLSNIIVLSVMVYLSSTILNFYRERYWSTQENHLYVVLMDVKRFCKSKGGLKIHSRDHMPSLLNIKVQEFDINKLKVIIKDSLIKLSIDSCYFDKVRDVFKNFKIEEESEEGPAGIMCIVQNYNGNPELFFNDIFKYCNSSNYFTEKLGQCHGALLIQEISLHLMKHLSDNIQGVNKSNQISMAEKERFGLQYFGGYVFHKIYKKLRNSKKWQSQFNTSCMAILRAGKCDTDDGRILVNVKNRGCLWLLTDNGQKLFENVEHLFRENTLGFKTKLQYDQLTLQILEDPSR